MNSLLISEHLEDSEVEKTPYLRLVEKEDGDLLDQVLKALSTREQQVLWLRFWEGKTLKSCGERMGVSRERVRQLEAKALLKCRHPSRMRILERSSEVECIVGAAERRREDRVKTLVYEARAQDARSSAEYRAAQTGLHRLLGPPIDTRVIQFFNPTRRCFCGMSWPTYSKDKRNGVYCYCPECGRKTSPASGPQEADTNWDREMLQWSEK